MYMQLKEIGVGPFVSLFNSMRIKKRQIGMFQILIIFFPIGFIPFSLRHSSKSVTYSFINYIFMQLLEYLEMFIDRQMLITESVIQTRVLNTANHGNSPQNNSSYKMIEFSISIFS